MMRNKKLTTKSKIITKLSIWIYYKIMRNKKLTTKSKIITKLSIWIYYKIMRNTKKKKIIF